MTELILQKGGTQISVNENLPFVGTVLVDPAEPRLQKKHWHISTIPPCYSIKGKNIYKKNMFRACVTLRSASSELFYSANVNVAGVSVQVDEVHRKTGKLMMGIYEKPEYETCFLAGGNFWELEAALLDEEKGVEISKCGYLGDHDQHSSQIDVTKRSDNNIVEGVQFIWSSSSIDFVSILWRFWSSHDPTKISRPASGKRKFGTGIWCTSDDQLDIAIRAKSSLQTFTNFPIQTTISMCDEHSESDLFKMAESHHQQRYYQGTQFTRRPSKRFLNFPKKNDFINQYNTLV